MLGLLGVTDDVVALVAMVWMLVRLTRRYAVVPREQHTASQQEDAATETDTPWDPYQILHVAPGASQDEITRAYRAQIKQYHPDRVADLGAELQQLAHQRTQDIQRAYTALKQEEKS